MHPIAFPRSRRFVLAVAVTLAALLMVAVSTAVKSAHSQSTANATHAFSGFHDKAIKMPNLQLGTIAMLKIPVAGSYVINAKLEADNNAPDGSIGRCVLRAGVEFDELTFDLDGYFGGMHEVLALQLTHTFTSPGSVTLNCTAGFGNVDAVDTKITAVQVANLSNVPI